MQSAAEAERRDRILRWFAKAKRWNFPADYGKAGADLHGALESHACRFVVTAKVPGRRSASQFPRRAVRKRTSNRWLEQQSPG